MEASYDEQLQFSKYLVKGYIMVNLDLNDKTLPIPSFKCNGN